MSTTNVTSPTLSTRHSAGVRFYPAMAMLVLVFCAMAFGPSLVNRTHRSGPLDLLAGFHGLVFCAWLVLFLVQSILAAYQKLGLHRILGTASILLAAAMIVLGYETSIAMARRGYDLSGDLGIRQDPLAGLYFPLLDTFMFGVLFTAAWLCRRRAAIHKRLMLLTITAALIPAPIAHFVGHFAFFRNKVLPTVLLIALSLAASAVYDQITRRQIHPVSLWIPVMIFIIENVSASFVIPTKEWHVFAARLIR